MQTSFKDKAGEYIRRHHLLEAGDTVVVGLSGGADSVALLSVLVNLGYKCLAAHCNFHLRGEESDRDEQFCEALCTRLGVELVRVDFDVAARMKSTGESIEMACRSLRYDWWAELLSSRGCKAVAVGHHKEDNVETFFINLLRGSGIGGLKAMLPRRGNVIRPLLEMTRAEILDYLDSIATSYVTDSTNLENDFTRNKLRNLVIPGIEDVFPGASQSVASSISRLQDNYALYNDFIDELTERYVDREGKIDIATVMIKEKHPRMVLFELLSRVGLNMTQTENILDSMNSGKGCPASGKVFKSTPVSYFLDRGVLIPITESDASSTDAVTVSLDKAPFSCRKLSLQDFCLMKNGGQLKKNSIYLDAAVLTGRPTFTLRSWRKGDRFRPFGMKGSRLVSDLFSDAKLSIHEKGKVRILLRNEDIIWVVGMRASDLYKVKDSTSEVLELSIL